MVEKAKSKKQNKRESTERIRNKIERSKKIVRRMGDNGKAETKK